MGLVSLEQYRGKRVCVALSGGIDSVCLLHCFLGEREHISVSAIHIEHGIRGEESLRDCEFVSELCKKWDTPLKICRVDVPSLAKQNGEGIEEAARRARYSAFAALTGGGEADLVATAHHLGDVAETVLFRLARGTSPAGMRAIGERDGIVRPFLSLTRAQIETYAAEHGLPHVEDSTNSDETYARNRIRHTVLPALADICPNAEEHLARFAFLTARDDGYLQELAASRIETRFGEQCVPVSLPEPLFFRACLQCMGGSKDVSAALLAELSRLRTLQSGRRVSLPRGLTAAREFGRIVFFRETEDRAFEIPFKAEAGRYETPVPFEVEERGGTFSLRECEGAICCDPDRFPEGCVVRPRHEGDFIVSFGGKKSLSKFFAEKGISARLGRKLSLIARGSEVFAVAGVEISEKVKVAANAERWLRIVPLK